MHVDVFKIEIFDKTARFIFSRDLIQPARNGCSVLCRPDTLLRQHRDVRFRSGDVLPPYSLVEWYGGIYLPPDRSLDLSESPAPTSGVDCHRVFRICHSLT